MGITSLVTRAGPSNPKGNKNTPKGAGNGLPSNAKPAGQFEPSYTTWLLLGNTALYGAIRDGTSDPEELPPIPVEWIIAPSSNSSVSDGQCPSMGETINSFVISDVVSGVIAVIICCRPILKKITCGFLGKLPDKPSRRCSSVWYSRLVGFSMTFLGNLFASLVVVNTEGYDHLSFAIIFALYASRPRMNMVLMTLFWVFVTVRTSDWSTYKPVDKGKEKEQSTEPSSAVLTTADDACDGRSSETQTTETDATEPLEKEYVYLDSYRSTVVAEMILHLISAVFIGVTWDRFPNSIIKKHMEGNVFFMAFAPALLFGTAFFAIPLHWRRDRRVDDRWLRGLTGVVLFGAAYAAPWVYWCSFLKLPGSLWCPPKLPLQTGIWIAFSLIGWCPHCLMPIAGVNANGL
ncbi:hypothetical protein CCHR01_04141 [Colletotrichum chrysophilum]|uniref:Uncharacterized protein n=1 Tax=Colletotrichum chrysophilum TaxID=1836956 RepID=A0AAD9ARJ7_9PEZI|nr:hypothetical protein CCHR01_04141 [Colletotrichum chrysophilum]